MEFDLENPLTNLDRGDSLCPDAASLFRVESDHMLSETYLKSLKLGDSDFVVRRETIFSISELCCNYDPFLSYLAVNYLDRFLSSQGLKKPQPWVFRLLAVSCLSLAAKMQKTDFSLPDFQAEGGLIFDVQTVQRMEMLILGALKWRMRSITPFSFLSFFIPLFKPEDPASRQALKARASEIIFKAQNDATLLEFKPSDIAASALLSAAHDLFPFQLPCFRRSIFSCSFVNKDGISGCYNAIQEAAAVEGHESIVDVLSSSDTPINVLDLQLSASESGATTGGSGGGSGTTSPARGGTVRSERLLKRRRMGESMSNQTVQITQF
ncbi:putative cyclin-D6-1 isoform X2 [Punica granatum]|uniref:Cyclin-D6-1 isoform X2 n=1 Tax=Punica granatum TaxID=22663 RepID=A0A6P8C893_PUNGR|nr:putative cyclin-D6-1 isoform X2 [Punica granatum]